MAEAPAVSTYSRAKKHSRVDSFQAGTTISSSVCRSAERASTAGTVAFRTGRILVIPNTPRAPDPFRKYGQVYIAAGIHRRQSQRADQSRGPEHPSNHISSNNR